MADLNEQIADLQARIAYQEDTIESLNNIVTEQDKQLQSLQEQFRGLYKKIDEMSYEMDGRKSTAQSERPPHY